MEKKLQKNIAEYVVTKAAATERSQAMTNIPVLPFSHCLSFSLSTYWIQTKIIDKPACSSFASTYSYTWLTYIRFRVWLVWYLLWQCSYFYIHTCHCIWKSPHRIKFRIFRMCARHVLNRVCSGAERVCQRSSSFFWIRKFLRFICWCIQFSALISYAIVHACHNGDHHRMVENVFSPTAEHPNISTHMHFFHLIFKYLHRSLQR